MYFAAADPDTNLALIGILGTVIVSLFALLNYLLKRSDKTIEKNTEAGTAQANATLKLSEAVAKLNTSIIERDAQDREFHKEVMKHFKSQGATLTEIKKKADRNYQAITAKTMHVKTMNVKTENVERQNNK